MNSDVVKAKAASSIKAKAEAWTFEAKAKATGAKAKAIGPEAKAKTIKIGLDDCITAYEVVEESEEFEV